MCLYPREKIKVAEEPILCLKIIGDEKRYLFGLLKFWRSPRYEINKNRRFGKVLIACERLHKELDSNDQIIINSGFHSYDDFSSAKHSFMFLYYGKKCIKPALIPQGAEYCFGNEGDIVANRIIVFENEKQREKYLQK